MHFLDDDETKFMTSAKCNLNFDVNRNSTWRWSSGRAVSASGSETSVSSSIPISAIIYDAYTSIIQKIINFDVDCKLSSICSNQESTCLPSQYANAFAIRPFGHHLQCIKNILFTCSL